MTKSAAPAKVRKEFITLPVRHAARRAFEYKMCIEVYSVQYCAQRTASLQLEPEFLSLQATICALLTAGTIAQFDSE